jgi:predicted nucleic acid-binding protein
MSCSDGVVAGHQYPVGEYISVVSIAEIRFGIQLQQDLTRRTELDDWLTLKLRPAFAGRILPISTGQRCRS